MLLLFMDFTTGCENKIFVRKTTFSPEVEYQDQNVGFYVIYNLVDFSLLDFKSIHS